MKIYRVIGVDSSHMHLFGLMRQVQQAEGFDLVGFADEDEEKRQRVSEEFGLGGSQLNADFRQLVADQRPDFAFICSTNSRHHEYVADLAELGVHCIVEKPFATHLWQVDAMVKACRENDVVLMCNFPTAWSASLRAAHQAVQEGAVGRVFQITFRGGHNGPTSDHDSWWYRPEDGGGVFLDYCCYGAAVATWFLGKLPKRVAGLAATLAKPVRSEDNAVLLAEYDDALCIFQATWTRIGKEPSYGPVINGLGGSITILGDQSYLLVTPEKKEGEVVKIEEPLPEGRRNAAEYMRTCIEDGHWPEGPIALEVTRGSQEILEAGQIALRTGSTVTLPVY